MGKINYADLEVVKDVSRSALPSHVSGPIRRIIWGTCTRQSPTNDSKRGDVEMDLPNEGGGSDTTPARDAGKAVGKSGTSAYDGSNLTETASVERPDGRKYWAIYALVLTLFKVHMDVARASRIGAWSLQTFSDHVFAASAMNEIEGLLIGIVAWVYFEYKGWEPFLGHPLINTSIKLWPAFNDMFRDGILHVLFERNSRKRIGFDFQCLFLLSMSNMWFFSRFWQISHDTASIRDLSLPPLVLLMASLTTICFSIFSYGVAKLFRIWLFTFGMILCVALFFYMQILFSAPVLKVVEITRTISTATSIKALYVGDIVLAILDIILIIPVLGAYVVILRDFFVLGRETLDRFIGCA